MSKVALCYHCGMSQPVKLSDALVLEARLAAEEQERSIAGQVEFWAKLGQSIDHLLKGPQVLALRHASKREMLSKRLASVDTRAGRARVEAYLETRPYPHYKEGGQPGLLVRIDEDGKETIGRFVNRIFVQMEVREQRRVLSASKNCEPASVVLDLPVKKSDSSISSLPKARAKSLARHQSS
jgi:hypothetical protein